MACNEGEKSPFVMKKPYFIGFLMMADSGIKESNSASILTQIDTNDTNLAQKKGGISPPYRTYLRRKILQLCSTVRTPRSVG